MTQSPYQTVLWSMPVKSDIIKKHWKHSWDATDVLFMRPFNGIKKVRSLQGTTFGGSRRRPSPPCIPFSQLKPQPCNYNCLRWIFSTRRKENCIQLLRIWSQGKHCEKATSLWWHWRLCNVFFFLIFIFPTHRTAGEAKATWKSHAFKYFLPWCDQQL